MLISGNQRSLDLHCKLINECVLKGFIMDIKGDTKRGTCLSKGGLGPSRGWGLQNKHAAHWSHLSSDICITIFHVLC